MEIAQWNGHLFTVTPQVIRMFNNLSLHGSCDTKEKEKGGQKYVTRKAGKPLEATFEAGLNAYTRCNVRDEAIAFAEEATRGPSAYLYVSGKRVFDCLMMLTDAAVSETQIAPDGTWIACKVQITLKQTMHESANTNVQADDPPFGGGGGGSKEKNKYKKMFGKEARKKKKEGTSAVMVDAISSAQPPNPKKNSYNNHALQRAQQNVNRSNKKAAAASVREKIKWDKRRGRLLQK